MTSLVTRLYRRRKRLLLAFAVLPLFQAMGTCDPFGINALLIQQLAQSTLGLVTGSIQRTLVQNFPGSDAIQGFLGGNPYPIFP